jgi:Tfp pilus assembly protein FimT
LNSAADEVQMALNAARLEAIKTNQAVTVNFDPPHESYEVLRNGTSLHSDRMPSGVDLKTVYEVGSTTVHNSIAFDSRGFPDQDVEISLVNTKNQSRVIQLSLTGSTRVD